ncbi:MAG TPA: hypothetical protein VF191_14995 [Cyclobacteriaceae bacterium]
MLFWLLMTGVVGLGTGFGQVKRQFNVENTESCRTISLSVRANRGNCYIKPSQNSDILNVFSNQDAQSFSHNFTKEIRNQTCYVSLTLEEDVSGGFGRTISTRVFGQPESRSDKYWKMYLTDMKPYILELNYGMGQAHVDLSGLSIRRLKITTGSADVNVGYESLENHIDMDTLYVKADLGTVNVSNINFSRARNVLADVGFGNMTLDFSGQPLVTNNVKGSVGAGNLTIILPDNSVPVLVKVRESWLCSVSISGNLKSIGNNTYVNEAYQMNPRNPLQFDLDVSMGNIIFKQSN